MSDLAAVLLIARILSIGAVIDAAEILLTQDEYTGNGIYCWGLMRTNNRRFTIGVTSWTLDRLFSQSGFMLLMIIQVLVALSVLARLRSPFCLSRFSPYSASVWPSMFGISMGWMAPIR